ncbi:MAG TPA: MipA/OmpV family protein [Rhodocyclaceae bacterium]|nr:MipA/OmpV family protein [Rhodocyclaceae bacterium]
MKLRLAYNICIALTVMASNHAFAEDAAFSGDVGLGVVQKQSIIRGDHTRTSAMPYLAFDYGRVFARIDNFGVKTLAVGYGHIELLGRYRTDGYQVSGFERRDTPVPLGVGTLQITPIGAFEIDVLRDFGTSAGAVAQARYIAKFSAGRVSVYPEFGVEMLSARYANYYYGTRQQDAATLGQSYTAGSATNPFLGVMVSTQLAERWTLKTYLRYTLLDDTIAHSPLVSREGKTTMFVAVARGF